MVKYETKNIYCDNCGNETKAKFVIEPPEKRQHIDEVTKNIKCCSSPNYYIDMSRR